MLKCLLRITMTVSYPGIEPVTFGLEDLFLLPFILHCHLP
uniref:Uncharacterized protein n=1 Tax=Anguilla anguilla TaxID=7936 RepID=A0A0E9V3G9_ANGAN